MHFINFIIKQPQNKRFLLIALSGTIIQFILFKLLYPFADFFSDSYSYIFAAKANLDINIWPIGYSKFLALFHAITYSDTALVAFQYFFLILSTLYLFFTVLYFYQTARNTTIILFLFLFFNPLFLYLCNYVNSDPLFVSVSVLWFTQLLWIINKPGIYQIFLQATLLFLAFTIRNNAYYYPLITVLAFAFSHQRLWRKVAGALLGLALIMPFVIYTRNVAYKMTGIHQYSLFTGWQLANNALYMYNDLQVDINEMPTAQTRELDWLSKQFYKNTIPDFQEALSSYVGNFFIRQPESPLKKYMASHYKVTDSYNVIIAWGKASGVFEEYGNYLIKHNLMAYVRGYMVLNAKNYFVPPLEKMEKYNLGMDEVWPTAQFWFHYKSNKVSAVSKKAQGVILYVFPPLFLVLNLYLLGNAIMFLIWKKYKQVSALFNRTLILAGSFLVSNFCFCVFATIIVFRYEIFPMVICFVCTLLLMELSDKKILENKIYENSKKTEERISVSKVISDLS